MMRKSFFCLLATLVCMISVAQNSVRYQQIVCPEYQESLVSMISDDLTEGRASGTPGKQLAEQFIVSFFREKGLKPYNWTYTQSFIYRDSIALRNVVGCIPANNDSDEYVIISAHYDHIGKIAGRIYNGADDNASGVAALLSIAEMFQRMKMDGAGPERNLIFVAFDGKELSMSGSEYFVRHLRIPRSKIICAVNMDMIGTDIEPVGKNKEFLIALGEKTLPEKYQGYLEYLTDRVNYKMDLDLTFYGSRDFTRMYYTMGDQNSFAKAGIPAILFTSGFHRFTYKPDDDPEIINFPLLYKRSLVIFRFIDNLCRN